MKVFLPLALLLSLTTFSSVSAFLPHSSLTSSSSKSHASSSSSSSSSFALKVSSSSSQETEAERLMRKARELRESATRAEEQVHGDLTQKKAERDAQTDEWIAEIFASANSGLVDRLRSKRFSVTTLERIVLRLDERQVRAQGWDHVQGKRTADGHTQFVRVSEPDPDEMARLEGKVEQLIQAVGVLDEEFRAQKQKKGEAYVAHSEETHWGGGKCAAYLQDRIREIRRERSEHFQKRMEELREAQRRKEDHKFDGYNDLGSLN